MQRHQLLVALLLSCGHVAADYTVEYEGQPGTTLPHQSKRFSTAFVQDERLFATRAGLEACKRECSLQSACLGVFSYSLSTSQQRQCYGLRSLGVPVSTRLSSVSLAKNREAPATHSMALEYSGVAGQGDGTPPTRFGTAFSASARAFSLSSVDLQTCLARCLDTDNCAGTFYWRPRQVCAPKSIMFATGLIEACRDTQDTR